MNYEIQTHALIVKPKNAPLYSEQATVVRLEDEGAGYYVMVEQQRKHIAITPEEWPHIREAIDRMMLLCQPAESAIMYHHPQARLLTWNGEGEKPDWMRDWIAKGNDPMDCLVS